MKKTIIVKIGGVASDNLTAVFFEQISKWQSEAARIIIVHGGGHYISEMMEKISLPITIKEGLRVTTKEVLEVTQMVLIGQVQPKITALFQQMGLKAVGLNAADDHLLVGRPIDQQKIGFVGQGTQVKVDILHDLLAKSYLPVIAPLAMTDENEWLNVNADAVACKIAAAMQADELYLLTDVPGIKKAGQWLDKISGKEIIHLIGKEVITGGMIPKLESARAALIAGVGQIHITNELQHQGTVITKEEEKI